MARTIEESVTVRKILADGERLFVSFYEHDGYFELTDPAQKVPLDAALSDGRTVHITADAELRILALR